MKICLATENIFVSAHFGHCEGFTIYEVEDNMIKNKEYVKNPGHQPGFLPGFLKDQGVDVIVSGGMGGKAIQLFNQKGIKAITGATGKVDDVMNKYLNDELQSTNSVCTEHQHQGECGEH